MREMINEYLRKYSKYSKQAIARKLYNDRPDLFTSIGSARSRVRYYTQANGKKDKSKVKSPIKFENKFSRENPFGLPESDAQEKKIFKLPKVSENILFLTDTHFPYQNNKAITAALKYGKETGIDTIYLNGDIMDCHHASTHEKDPRKRNLADELEMVGGFLDALKKHFPNAKIYYKEGNHERRWRRLLRSNAPMLVGCDEFRLDVLLKLGEKGIEWIDNETLVMAGNLNILHGNEFKGSGGINTARNLYLKTADNTIAGDKHKTQTAIKNMLGGGVVRNYSVGCLSELSPEWLPFNDWNLGFARIILKNNDFKVENLIINSAYEIE